MNKNHYENLTIFLLVHTFYIPMRDLGFMNDCIFSVEPDMGTRRNFLARNTMNYDFWACDEYIFNSFVFSVLVCTSQ